jgi:hypothetical protein
MTLLVIEWQFSYKIAKYFFADIEGPVPFYAINTSLTFSVLWATALVFTICLQCIDKTKESQDYFFYISQVIMFFYLGMDERFMIHERLGRWFNFNDAYWLLFLGFVEIGLLLKLGDIYNKPSRNLVFIAALLFAVMIVIDATFPKYLLFRLSLEDLSKLWSAILLFLFAWDTLLFRLKPLQQK